MVTLAITEEGRSAAYTQRAFFMDLDDAETAKDVQATCEAVQRNSDEEFRALLRKHLYAVNDGFIVPCLLDMSAAWETIAKGVNAAPYDHEKVAERAMALVSANRDDFTEALRLARAAHPEQRIAQIIVNAVKQLLFYVSDAELCEALRTYASGTDASGTMSQSKAEAVAYLAADEFIKATNESGAFIPMNHEGLNAIKHATQKALDQQAPGQWVVDAALPDSDWSRTPAVTVRRAASSQPADAPHLPTL
jgi:hypothetical protein